MNDEGRAVDSNGLLNCWAPKHVHFYMLVLLTVHRRLQPGQPASLRTHTNINRDANTCALTATSLFPAAAAHCSALQTPKAGARAMDNH